MTTIPIKIKPEVDKKLVAKMLQARIDAMQGLGKLSETPANTGLSPFNRAFPDGVFPMGTLHEFVSYEPAHAASTNGFIAALTAKIMRNDGLCLWISSENKTYPVGLKYFGMEPDHVVFIHATKPKDKLWIIEEALKCEALGVVIAEMKELGFTESRRLQLAVERSGVTAFIHRYAPRFQNSVACTARWQITPLPSITIDGLPGLGYSCWNVALLKVKNGRPDAWKIGWISGQFTPSVDGTDAISLLERYTG